MIALTATQKMIGIQVSGKRQLTQVKTQTWWASPVSRSTAVTIESTVLVVCQRIVGGQHHHVSYSYLYQYSNHAAWLEDHRRRRMAAPCLAARRRTRFAACGRDTGRARREPTVTFNRYHRHMPATISR